MRQVLSILVVQIKHVLLYYLNLCHTHWLRIITQMGIGVEETCSAMEIFHKCPCGNAVMRRTFHSRMHIGCFRKPIISCIQYAETVCTIDDGCVFSAFLSVVTGSAHHGIVGNATQDITQLLTYGFLHAQKVGSHIVQILVNDRTTVLPCIASVTVGNKDVAHGNVVRHDADLFRCRPSGDRSHRCEKQKKIFTEFHRFQLL